MNSLATSAPPRRLSAALEQAGMLVILAVLLAACSLGIEGLLSATNLKDILLAVAIRGMVACTMLFCLASGNFDLSVGTVVPCAGVLAAVVMRDTGSFALGLGAGLACGAGVGLVNGTVVAVCRINPLITTLATMQIVKGLTFKICDNVAVGITSEPFLWLGTSSPLGVQTPVWLCLFCFGGFGFLLARTTFGRNTLALGGNEEAARLAGIAVTRLKIIIFTMQGLVAAFAGMVLAARMGSGQPKSSEGFELEVIAACVLGGVSLTGGVGRMSFVVAGVLIMGVVENAMALLNIDPVWRYVVRGVVLLAAVLFDRYKQVRAEKAAERPGGTDKRSLRSLSVEPAPSLQTTDKP